MNNFASGSSLLGIVTVRPGFRSWINCLEKDGFIRAYFSCLYWAVLAVLLCPYFVATSGPTSLRAGGVKGIVSALPASRPCERGTVIRKGRLFCVLFTRDSSKISGSQRISLFLNVLESRQLSISCVSEQRLPRELLIKWSCCWTSISICVQLSSSSPTPDIPCDEEAHKNGYWHHTQETRTTAELVHLPLKMG
jgi:hypothetical protein